jgi:hypothetical protein
MAGRILIAEMTTAELQYHVDFMREEFAKGCSPLDDEMLREFLGSESKHPGGIVGAMLSQGRVKYAEGMQLTIHQGAQLAVAEEWLRRRKSSERLASN